MAIARCIICGEAQKWLWVIVCCRESTAIAQVRSARRPVELFVEARRSFEVRSTAQSSGAAGEGYEGYPGRRKAERGGRARR
jgi:hypothetical protein